MTRILQLHGQRQTLLLALPMRGMPRILAHTSGPLSLLPEGIEPLLDRASRVNGMDVSVPGAVLSPTGGLGLFQWPAIAGHRDGRDFTFEPGDWSVAERGSRAATLTGRDTVASLTLTIEIAFGAGDVMTMRSALRNDGDGTYTLDRLMAGSVALGRVSSVLTFDGTWGREFQLVEEQLGSATWLKESRRGRTSHDRFPGLLVATEGRGGAPEWLGLHLGASGNHVIAIDRLDNGGRLLHAGELLEPGEIRLASGEAYESPVVHVARGPDLDAVSAAFHAHVRSDILRWPGGVMRPRPVTLNTWEGTYFAHDVEALKRQASTAAALGIERFVLDDGWFGRRDDDSSSLGDWWVDERKYPYGLGPLIDHVTGLGMEFGIWLEPEMVNPSSELFRAHSDWALQVAGRPFLLSRHQLVLDLTRAEVSAYLFQRIDALLRDHAIACVKWDMNRDLTHAGGADGRAVTSRQTRAALALMDRVREAHPQVEIESCASGGGRADYGALARTHRIWTSDCTDALERVAIQRGASIFLPPEVLGAHVSAAPNHQTGRTHTLDFRCLVALPYHLGVELDPLSLEPAERVRLTAFIALHKRLRPLLHAGRTLGRDLGDGRQVLTILAADGRHAVVLVIQTAAPRREQPAPLTIEGLAAGAYRLAIPAPQTPAFVRATTTQTALLGGEIPVDATALAAIGLPLPMLRPEAAVLVEITQTPGD